MEKEEGAAVSCGGKVIFKNKGGDDGDDQGCNSMETMNFGPKLGTKLGHNLCQIQYCGVLGTTFFNLYQHSRQGLGQVLGLILGQKPARHVWIF